MSQKAAIIFEPLHGQYLRFAFALALSGGVRRSFAAPSPTTLAGRLTCGSLSASFGGFAAGLGRLLLGDLRLRILLLVYTGGEDVELGAIGSLIETNAGRRRFGALGSIALAPNGTLGASNGGSIGRLGTFGLVLADTVCSAVPGSFVYLRLGRGGLGRFSLRFRSLRFAIRLGRTAFASVLSLLGIILDIFLVEDIGRQWSFN